MIRSIAIAVAALSLAAVPSYAAGTQCRDAHGKFIKCPPKAPPTKPVRCKDAKGKFAKCGTPGAKPVK
ncbi:MAG: hypothetical protein ACTHM8_03120 [Sphingomonas sp.]